VESGKSRERERVQERGRRKKKREKGGGHWLLSQTFIRPSSLSPSPHGWDPCAFSQKPFQISSISFPFLPFLSFHLVGIWDWAWTGLGAKVSAQSSPRRLPRHSAPESPLTAPLHYANSPTLRHAINTNRNPTKRYARLLYLSFQ